MKRAVRKILQKVRFKLNDFGFDVRPIDNRCWEDQTKLLAHKSVSTIVDAGANTGSIAQMYRGLFPGARLLCFEPVEEHLAALNCSFSRDRNFKSFGVALGDQNGYQEFFINAHKDTSSLLEADSEHLNDSYSENLRLHERTQIQVRTLDSICHDEGIASIDILKMDVQGGELGILRGAGELLGEQRIAIIYCEVFFVPMYRDQPLFGDVAAFLSTYRYRFHFLYNYVFNGRSGRLYQADAIFVAPELGSLARSMLSTF